MRSTAGRVLRLALAVGLSGVLAAGGAVLIGGCGSRAARAQVGGGDTEDTGTTVQRLDARVSELSGEVEDLRTRLTAAETRLGPSEPAPPAAKPWTVGGRISLPKKLNRLASAGAAPVSVLPAPGPAGSAYVISFWATWCKPCTTPEELVLIGQLQQQLKSQGLGFLNLAVDEMSKVRGDARAPGWVYPVWQADDAHIDLLPEAFIKKSGLGLPLFLVVDGRGVPRFWRNRNLDPASVGELVALARGL